MNILFCGNDAMEKGLLLTVLSLLEHEECSLSVYVMTMTIKVADRQYHPIGGDLIEELDRLVKRKHAGSFVRLIDATEAFLAEFPSANIETRFTPYCMLRLYADLCPELTGKLLYLDTDVLCRESVEPLFDTDISDVELAGVYDFYGSHIYKKHLFKRDYLNSGVLLMNMDKIRQTGLLARCRRFCKEEQTLLPDQAALNKYADRKLILPRKYNEQRRLHKDTVCHHFTTTFRLFPYFHKVTVKPWDVETVHERLKLHDYDDLLDEFNEQWNRIKTL